MPIYEVGEHEILSSESVLEREDGDTENGSLYLSDKRIIFEKKGRRGLLKASPSQIVVDVFLYNITNVSSVVPRIKALTKKYLLIEYHLGNDIKKARFRMNDPLKWESEMRKWISDAKRAEEERIQREKEEEYRKEVEMARAKAGTTNVGVAYYGNPNNKKKKKSDDVGSSDFIDAEQSQGGDLARMQQGTVVAAEDTMSCPHCGSSVKKGMKFCPNCGEKL